MRRFINVNSRKLFGLCRTEVKQLTFQLAEKMELLHDFNRDKKMTGDHWLELLRKRKTQISLRTPEPCQSHELNDLTDLRFQTTRRNVNKTQNSCLKHL